MQLYLLFNDSNHCCLSPERPHCEQLIGLKSASVRIVGCAERPMKTCIMYKHNVQEAAVDVIRNIGVFRFFNASFIFSMQPTSSLSSLRRQLVKAQSHERKHLGHPIVWITFDRRNEAPVAGKRVWEHPTCIQAEGVRQVSTILYIG